METEAAVMDVLKEKKLVKQRVVGRTLEKRVSNLYDRTVYGDRNIKMQKTR